MKGPQGEDLCLSVFVDVPAGATEVWAGPLSNQETVVVLFNRGEVEADITADFSLAGAPNPTTGSFAVRDLWAHEDLGIFQGSFTATSVPPHGVVAVKLTPQ